MAEEQPKLQTRFRVVKEISVKSTHIRKVAEEALILLFPLLLLLMLCVPSKPQSSTLGIYGMGLVGNPQSWPLVATHFIIIQSWLPPNFTLCIFHFPRLLWVQRFWANLIAGLGLYNNGNSRASRYARIKKRFIYNCP